LSPGRRDGKTLASGEAGQLLKSADEKKTVKLWDAQTRQALATLRGHDGHVSSVAFSPDDKTLASGSYDMTVKLWVGDAGNEAGGMGDVGVFEQFKMAGPFFQIS
jgi:WD40 repeat protein